MQIAFSSLACPGWSVEEIAGAAGEHGYDGVEWRLADGALLGPRTGDDVWRRIAAAGVPAVCLDTSCVFVKATNSTIEEAIAMGHRADEIGADAIRVFGGSLPAGEHIDDVLTPAREALAHAAEGMPHDVRLLVETHDAWSTGTKVSALIEGLDAGVLWDVVHTVRAGETPGETLRRTGCPELVHVKDARGPELVELGDGDIPMLAAVAALRSVGYDGWLSFEWEKLWHPELAEPETVLPRAAAYLRELAR